MSDFISIPSEEKMTIIAIDCDEVLIDTTNHLSLYVKEKFWYDWFYHDYKYYMLHENDHIDMDFDTSQTLVNDYYNSPEAKDALPIEGAQEAVQKLLEVWHKLYVVTARHEWQKALTYWQIDNFFPDIFTDIHFAHHHTEKRMPKSQLCNEVWATILIEDNIDYALEASEKGIQTFLLERPRNHWRQETHPLMTKVKHWSEIHI